MVEEFKMKYANINLTGRKYKLRKKNKITGIIIDILSVTFVIVGIILLISGFRHFVTNKDTAIVVAEKINKERVEVSKIKSEKNIIEKKFNSIEIDEKRFDELKKIGEKLQDKPITIVLNKIEKNFMGKDLMLNEFSYNMNRVKMTIQYNNSDSAMAVVSDLQKEFGDVSVVENRDKTIKIEIDLKKSK